MLEARPCCGRVSRGLAILGDTLYMGTIDAHLVAIDAKTGKILWDHAVEKVGDKVTEKYAITHAPVIVKDKIIVGIAGGDLGVRGFICAFDAKDGQGAVALLHDSRQRASRATRRGRATRGRPAAPACGTAARTMRRRTSSTSAPAIPRRTGTAASASATTCTATASLALDADTGKLKWHYQFTPHDEVDYDSTQVPVLADIQWQGRPRKVMLWANRNGLAYVLDRDDRRVSARQALRQSELDGQIRHEGPADARPRAGADAGGRADHADRARRDELGAAVVQPAHGPVLRRRLGKHGHRSRSRAGSRGAAGIPNGTPMGQATLTPNSRKKKKASASSARSIRTADEEVGIQDERHHVGRRAHDGV